MDSFLGEEVKGLLIVVVGPDFKVIGLHGFLQPMEDLGVYLAQFCSWRLIRVECKGSTFQ